MEHTGKLSGNQLKLIAIIAMTIDHLTWAFFPGLDRTWYVLALHVIGRLTAPIMWFFIAEGFHWTHDVKKYMLRLFLFAFVSHFAYDFAFGIPFLPLSTGFFNQTSVLWSLAISVALLAADRYLKLPNWAFILCVVFACLIAFPSDWSSIAVMAPFFLYKYRSNFRMQAIMIVAWTAVYALVYILFLDPVYGILQMATCLSIPLLSLYNGQRGSFKGMKWLFYWYYPAHLVLVGILRLVLNGNIPIIF